MTYLSESVISFADHSGQPPPFITVFESSSGALETGTCQASIPRLAALAALAADATDWAIPTPHGAPVPEDIGAWATRDARFHAAN